MPDLLASVLLAGGAAGFGVIGAAGALRSQPQGRAWLGWANALAAGVMFGSAYALITRGSDLHTFLAALGALAGVLWVALMHALVQAHDLELNRLGGSPAYARTVVKVSTLHSAMEGLAIGAALALDVRFGVVTAVAIGLHNVPEADVVARVLRSAGLTPRRAMGQAALANASQIVLAAVGVWLAARSPGTLAGTLGFAAGGLVYLVLAELLPESYRQAGHTSIAVVVLLAMGLVMALSAVGA